MRFVVNTQEFITTMNSLTGGRRIANLTVENGWLLIQSFEPIITSQRIPIIKMLDSNGNNSLSFEVNPSYNLFEKETVELTFEDSYLIAVTDDCRLSFQVVYDARMNISGKGKILASNLKRRDIDILVKAIRTIESITKVLKEATPAVIINDKKAYLTLSSFAIRIPVDLPNMTVSTKTIKALSDFLHQNSQTTFNITLHGESDNQAKISLSDEDDCWCAFTMLKRSVSSFNVIDDGITNAKKVTTVSFDGLSDKLSVIQKTYGLINADLEFYEKAYGILISQGATSHVSIGSVPNVKESVVLRTNNQTLSAIVKLCSGETEVLKGGRLLCLKCNPYSLLLTGVTSKTY